VGRTITDWLSFFDSRHFIYVNARHKDVHYRLIAKESAALVPAPDARVLDYGCGEALHADLVAEAAGELILCDAAPGLRAALEQRFTAHANIRVMAPHEIARLKEHSLDLIILHSVVQYLTPAGTSGLFTLFRGLLKADGLLVVSDVVPAGGSTAADTIALLKFGKDNGFLLAAIWGLVRTLLSDYSRLRSRLGLTAYSEPDMIEKLNAAGFTASRAPKNIGHSSFRVAYYARPR
jgi:SAM-dependent methyltransferase